MSESLGFPPFAPAYRASGLLLHITSLPSPYGIGDFGPAALAWIDRLQDAGQSWWQMLPLGPTGYGNSPYQPLSSFARNELLISPDWLIEDGLLRAGDCSPGAFPQDEVDYDSVIPFKQQLLQAAWARFHSGVRPELRPAYEQFCNDQAHWLNDYALFRALKAKFNGKYYLEWPKELIEREPAALKAVGLELEDQIGLTCFAQFISYRQAGRMKAHAQSRGLKLIGDLPFFVSPDSSDVWANPELFLLDEGRRPQFVAGVPPDYFSVTGQLWGNPVYNWDALRDTGYRWWIDRLRAVLNNPRKTECGAEQLLMSLAVRAAPFALLNNSRKTECGAEQLPMSPAVRAAPFALLGNVDVVRLDHFRGFSAAWHVPAGAQTAQQGSWRPGPGVEFFSAVQRELGSLPFIAEDLGQITPDVYALRDQFQMPGMRVLQFAFDGHSDNPHLPENYVTNTVVYTGTHDNPTTRAWYDAMPADQRQNLWKHLKRPMADPSDAAWTLMDTAWPSPAGLAIAPLQDVLNLGDVNPGRAARMNVPGCPGGNWRWRCTENMLSDAAFERVRDLTESSNRLGAEASLSGIMAMEVVSG